jgi:lipopolysaccharide export LptBFGC system permease protein LptF
LTIGISLFSLYYAAMIYAENLARSGGLPRYLAAWGPALLLGAFALYLFKKEASK